jgi:hypothetical protein
MIHPYENSAQDNIPLLELTHTTILYYYNITYRSSFYNVSNVPSDL